MKRYDLCIEWFCRDVDGQRVLGDILNAAHRVVGYPQMCSLQRRDTL